MGLEGRINEAAVIPLNNAFKDSRQAIQVGAHMLLTLPVDDVAFEIGATSFDRLTVDRLSLGRQSQPADLRVEYLFP